VAGTSKSSKRLYQGGNGSTTAAQGNGAGNGTGLDELADVVASSGLARSGLRHDPASRTVGAAPSTAGAASRPAAGSRVSLLAAAGAVIIVLVCIIVWLATRTSQTPGSEN
jgi:hypothetical protein